MTFRPSDYMIKVGGKDYLPVPARVMWFREDHPLGQIVTEVLVIEPPLVKASIYTEAGQLLATSHAGAVDKGNAVWKGRAPEKAETAAIGRALGLAGFGTQFSGDELDDADNLSDSPQEPRKPSPPLEQSTAGMGNPVDMKPATPKTTPAVPPKVDKNLCYAYMKSKTAYKMLAELEHDLGQSVMEFDSTDAVYAAIDAAAKKFGKVRA